MQPDPGLINTGLFFIVTACGGCAIIGYIIGYYAGILGERRERARAERLFKALERAQRRGEE